VFIQQHLVFCATIGTMFIVLYHKTRRLVQLCFVQLYFLYFPCWSFWHFELLFHALFWSGDCIRISSPSF